MKNLSLSLALFTLATISLSAHAEYNVVNCDSIRGTSHMLTLVVVDQNLKQVRIQSSNARRSTALMPVKIINQNIKGITLYTVAGLPGLMKVDNQVLTGNGGLVDLANDEFSCL